MAEEQWGPVRRDGSKALLSKMVRAVSAAEAPDQTLRWAGLEA